MEMVLIQLLGALAFFVGTLHLGSRLRATPTKPTAERLSRASHALFWLGLVAPEFAGLFHPGVTGFDPVLGWPGLPWQEVRRITGTLALLTGGYYLAASNFALKRLGAGFAAFKLTREVVDAQVYQRVRNPMSLGTYLAYLGIALLAGSTYLLLGTLCVIMPVHLFNLLYFEELELRLRYGASYEAYRQRVPFMFPSLSRNASAGPAD